MVWNLQRQGSKTEYPITRKLWLEERRVMTTTPPAPEAIIEMVKCSCEMLNKSVPKVWANLHLTLRIPCALQQDDSDEYIDDNDESDNSYDSASDDDEDD